MDSRCSNRPFLEGRETFRVTIDALPEDEKSFKVVIDAILEQNNRQLREERKIERVPLLLRNNESNNKDYNPRMVSIGPYHHGKKELQAAEKVKPIIANMFVSNSGKTLYEFYSAILQEVISLKSCYEEESVDKYSKEEFATMMLWDGCLIKVDARRILENQQPLHLLELIHICHRDPNSERNKRVSNRTMKYKMEEILYYFRSVSELKAKGVFVRCSGSYLPSSVNFKSFFFFGLLYLPFLVMSAESRIIMSNFLVYELSQGDCDMYTAHIMFMTSLINHPDDVKELRSNHILMSQRHSSDEEVVNLINSITTCTLDISKTYQEVRDKIQRHCNSKAKTWIAELIHKYLNSPWAFIAFFAGSLAIVMTGIQTYLTVFPRSLRS
ncbi:hypothetical protein NMG60_11003439 [Bertholletia excelsa]